MLICFCYNSIKESYIIIYELWSKSCDKFLIYFAINLNWSVNAVFFVCYTLYYVIIIFTPLEKIGYTLLPTSPRKDVPCGFPRSLRCNILCMSRRFIVLTDGMPYDVNTLRRLSNACGHVILIPGRWLWKYNVTQLELLLWYFFPLSKYIVHLSVYSFSVVIRLASADRYGRSVAMVLFEIFFASLSYKCCVY